MSNLQMLEYQQTCHGMSLQYTGRITTIDSFEHPPYIMMRVLGGVALFHCPGVTGEDHLAQGVEALLGAYFFDLLADGIVVGD